jgi:hypothetical protein
MGTILLLSLALAGPARTQTPAPGTAPSAFERTVRFLGGAASGLVIHESGHLIFGAAFGAHPFVKSIHYGPIPFFAIEHQPVTSGKEYVISSAGLWMQHAGSEWLLTARPNLRGESAPFLKGVFAFNLGCSAMYAVAAMGRFGPPERDTRGMAVTLRTPEPVVGVLVLTPALLDGYRYLRPNAAWAKWASRAAKISLVVLTIRARR